LSGFVLNSRDRKFYGEGVRRASAEAEKALVAFGARSGAGHGVETHGTNLDTLRAMGAAGAIVFDTCEARCAEEGIEGATGAEIAAPEAAGDEDFGGDDDQKKERGAREDDGAGADRIVAELTEEGSDDCVDFSADESGRVKEPEEGDAHEEGEQNAGDEEDILVSPPEREMTDGDAEAFEEGADFIGEIEEESRGTDP
jgi:hypothetical protein